MRGAMTLNFSKFLALVLAALLVASCANRSAVSSFKESEYSDYLFAVYASANGDREIATKSYLNVLKENPTSLRLMEEAFSYFLYVGDYSNAFKISQDFYAAKPNNTPLAMMLAIDAFREGRSDDMDLYLSEVRGFGFDTLMTPLMNAWMKAKLGDIDGALEALVPLADYEPFDSFYYENRALILDYAGRDKGAGLAYARQVASNEMSSLQPVIYYGAFLQKMKQYDDARALYERFLVQVPGNTQLTYALARLERGDKPLSIAQDPDKALAMSFLRTGVAVGSERTLVPAIIYSRLALLLDPGLDEAHMYLGGLLTGEVTPNLALESFSRVSPRGPYGEEIILRKALVLSSYDRWDEAIGLLKALLDQTPDSEDGLVTLGDLYRNREDFENALVYYDRAIALKGDLKAQDWFLLFTRGITLERLGRWQEAEADFLKTLTFRPGEADVLNYLGYTWVDQGVHLEEGRKMIERAVAQRPNSGYIVDSLGWAQYLVGDYEAAVKTLEKAVYLQAGDPTLNDHLGDAYWKVGREREARFQWDHAIKLGAGPDEVKKIASKIEFGPDLAAALEAKK